MRLVDAIGRVDPTWVEAVAVVQAVCAQLDAGAAPPALTDIMLSSSGAVSFPASAPADAASAVRASGALLSAILRHSDCPLPVWEATEKARQSPSSYGSARGFGASLTCLPASHGPAELAGYFQDARRARGTSPRPPTSAFGLRGLTTPALFAILAVACSGIGAGVSVGSLLAARAIHGMSGLPAAQRVANLTLGDAARFTPRLK